MRSSQKPENVLTLLTFGHSYLDDGAGLGEDVVDGVTRDPDHRGEGHEEPEDLRPAGIHVVVTIGDGAVGDAVEDEHREHHERSEVFPAEIPEHVGSDPGHLLHAVTEPLRSKHPANGDSLEETDPEQRHSRTAIEIHQLEGIDAALKKKKLIFSAQEMVSSSRLMEIVCANKFNQQSSSDLLNVFDLVVAI